MRVLPINLAHQCEILWPLGWVCIPDTRPGRDWEERAKVLYRGVEFHVRSCNNDYFVWYSALPTSLVRATTVEGAIAAVRTMVRELFPEEAQKEVSVPYKEKLTSFRVRIVAYREVTVSADNIATVASWLMNRQGNELFSDPGDWNVQSIEAAPAHDTVEVFADGTWKEVLE